MGIFSFLFTRDQYDVETVPAETEKAAVVDTEQSSLPAINVGMAIDVMEESGRVLNDGLVTEYKDRELTLGRKPGALSFRISEIGSTLFIRGCDSKMTQFYLRARVAESTRTVIKLCELEPEVRDNHRRNFRLAINTPISIFYLNDERRERPEKCVLVDISTEGCCIQTEYLHGEGEVIVLKVKLDEYIAMDLVGEIIRVNDCGTNGFRCGVLFAQLKKEETESLTKMLYNIQISNRREHSRSEDGHW